ncbi:nitrilase-related carbon-nitrogen hydrolase [Caballeronia ptereochthonis]|uniref:Carbon-nitrogen hydrolase n=1 Tax=Caballeronia ptereochthonis TaxID=1777144 RepID=A0A158A427_9BURK|nr:nitrilase-related carbon-nitrogen hydrolase [Caballeronia ptereochthonis]SAK52530.1 carbon-nitrogen hydrolase [Caballeronia ptereochthonis]
MDATSFRVAVIAPESRHGDAACNCALVTEKLSQAARSGVQLAVFPQSCISGPDDETLAEPFDGPSIDAIAAAVDKTGVAAGVGWIERTGDGRLHDSYAVCFPGGPRVRHRKLHATHRGLHGGNRFTVFDAPFGVRIGILIGGDNDVVENVRMTALMGATLLIAPMSGAASRRAPLVARAADNGMYIAYSHPSSDEAMIVGPDGRVLARGSTAHGGLIVAQVKPALAEASMGRRALAARRPDLYEPLARQGSAYPLAAEPERVTSRGALPLSFAIVGRNRVVR